MSRRNRKTRHQTGHGANGRKFGDDGTHLAAGREDRLPPFGTPTFAGADPSHANAQHDELGDDGAGQFMPFDERLLDVCRTRWQFGDWAGLTALDPGSLRHHPERGRVALLVASAYFQQGQTQQAHRLLQSALDWGASRRQALQMLISGTHQCLAEARGLLLQAEPARQHYREAIRTGGVPGDVGLLANVRELHKTSEAE